MVDKWRPSYEQQINWNNIPPETVKEYWQRSVYFPLLDIAFSETKHFPFKKRGHIWNYAYSSSSMRKRNGIMLCHHQHIFMVNWSDEDHFVCDNKMTHCRYILLKHPRTSDTVHHSCRKYVAREVFFNDWLRNNKLTDLLGDLAIIAVHGHTIVILKADMCSAI